MTTYEVNGTTIAVYEYSNEGDVIVLLHPGGIFASYVWQDTIDELKENYRVIAIDLRGHGNSGKSSSGYALTNLATDVIEVLKQMNIDKAHFAGNSLGGEVALILAATYPQFVKSLTLVDGGMLNLIGPRGEREGTADELIQERFHRPYPEYESREQFVQFVKESWTDLARFAEDIPVHQLPNGNVTFQQNNEIAAQLLQAGCDIDLAIFYDRLACPVLYMPAEKEEHLDWKLELIEEKRPSLPLAKTVIIPESTHLMMLEHGKEIGQAIQQFLTVINQ